MTYSSFEGSEESGRPVEIYQISLGGTHFYYTSSDTTQTLAAQDYIPLPGLERSQTTDGPSKREDDFQITLPSSHAISQVFAGTLPGHRIRIQVKRFHRDDIPTPEVVRIFDGYIHSASFKKNGKQAILVARTELSATGKQIPRRTFQSSCNHVLYEADTCRVVKEQALYRASNLSVATLVGPVLTVSAGLLGEYTDGYMNGGYVEVVGAADFRLITNQVGNQVTMFSSFSSRPASVNIYAGCAHTIEVCSSKFNNTIAFGGFSFVPHRNPHTIGV